MTARSSNSENGRTDGDSARFRTLARRAVIERTSTDDDTGPRLSRRSLLGTLGLAGALGVATGTASADPQGQLGTSTDPLTATYTEELNGGVTDYFPVTSLLGNGLSLLDPDEDGNYELALTTYSNNTFGETFRTTIAGGGSNTIKSGAGSATIGGGYQNTVETNANKAVIGGGRENQVKSDVGDATISGGFQNVIYDNYGTVGGGDNNQAGSNDGDRTTATHATVAGGDGNTASGMYATVPGGRNATASGNHSFAAGRQAKTETSGGTVHDGAFVWGDSSTTAARSQATDQVVFQATGGFVVAPEADTTTMLDIQDKDGNSLLAADTTNHTVQVFDGDASDSVDVTHDGTNGSLSTTTGNLRLSPASDVDLSGSTLTDTSTGDLLVSKATDSTGTNDTKSIRLDATESETGDTANIELDVGTNNGNLVANNLGTGSGTSLVIDGSGNVVENTSSARFKTNVEPLSTPSDRVLDVQPRTYEREETGEREVGLIAEEVDGTLPELVVYDDEDRPYGVQYDRLGVFLLPAVSENRDRLEAVRGAGADREARIDDLEADAEATTAHVEAQSDRIETLERELEHREDRIEAQSDRIETLESETERLREENERLRDRLDAIEAHLSD